MELMRSQQNKKVPMADQALISSEEIEGYGVDERRVKTTMPGKRSRH